MAKAKQDLVPRRAAESSAAVYGRALNNRVRALLDQAFDLIEKGRKDVKGRTYVEALADAILESPIAGAERVDKLVRDPEDKPGDAKGLNIGSLYLMAVQGAQTAAAAPRVLELEPERGTIGVQATPSDW